MREISVVGFIGLGDIGAPIAQRILNTGFKLIVWNRTTNKMAPLLSAGAQGAKYPAELASKVDIICTCVNGVQAMEEILFGPQGVIKGERRAKLIIDNSTLPPHITKQIGQRLIESDIGLIDSPVSGGAIGACAGTLAAMVGGDPCVFELVRPIIASYAGRITYMGPLGAGQAAKACNQIINFGNMAALSEAIALGSRFGVDLNKLPEAVSGGFADSKILQEYNRSIKSQDFSPIRYIIEAMTQYHEGVIDPSYQGKFGIHLKDLGIALEMGREVYCDMTLTAYIENLFKMLHYQDGKG